MKLKKDNRKDIVEVTEDEVIIKGLFKNKIIKKEDILSACLLEDRSGNEGIVILGKDYKIFEKRKINLRWEDREKLKIIIDEINNKDIIFNYTNIQDDFLLLISICGLNSVFISLCRDITETHLGMYIAIGIYFIIAVSLINVAFGFYRFRGVLYNLKEEKFYVVGRKNIIIKSFTMNDIEFIEKKRENSIKLKVKNDDSKFTLNKVRITYPVAYQNMEDELKEKLRK